MLSSKWWNHKARDCLCSVCIGPWTVSRKKSLCVMSQFTISNRAELRKANSYIYSSHVFVCMLSELCTGSCVTCINLLSRVHKQTPFIIFTQTKKKIMACVWHCNTTRTSLINGLKKNWGIGVVCFCENTGKVSWSRVNCDERHGLCNACKLPPLMNLTSKMTG
jgi:hypothetical protein